MRAGKLLIDPMGKFCEVLKGSLERVLSIVHFPKDEADFEETVVVDCLLAIQHWTVFELVPACFK